MVKVITGLCWWVTMSFWRILFTLIISGRALQMKSLALLGPSMKSYRTTRRLAHTTIIGAGAVGSFYGSRLVAQGRADDSFTFFSMREKSRHIQNCREKGLTVESVTFDKQHIPHGDRTYFSSNTNDLKESDWVLITLKGTNDAFDSLEELLPQVLKDDGTSRVVAIMNGLVDQRVAEVVESTGMPVASISGCAAYICANRHADGVVNHSYLGDLKGGVVKTIGSPDAEADRLAGLWEGSGVAFAAEEILPLRWLKSCWNVPFNGMCTVINCTTDKIAGDENLREECTNLMEEIIEAANADLTARGKTKRRLGDGDKAQMWAHTDTMGVYYPSTLLDFRAGSELELQFMFDEIVKRGRAYGVDMARTERLVGQLHEIRK